MITPGLRRWFVVHFVADLIFAVPLMVAPRATLELFGWRHAIDPIATRLVAAALLGIGIESFLGRNGGVEAYRTMLRLKIIWSYACIVALVWSAAELHPNGPPFAYAILAVYVAFGAVWTSYRWRLAAAPRGPTNKQRSTSGRDN